MAGQEKTDLYMLHDWPEYKKPCETCMFKMTPKENFCIRCVHYDQKEIKETL